MKTMSIAAAVAASLALTGCINNDAEAAEVYGSAEAQFTNTNGVYDITNGDTYVGVQVNEDLGNGLSAIANLSLDVDSEGANSPSTRDAYVGLATNNGSIKAGRMTNIQGSIGDMSVDVFEGPGPDTDSAGRINNTVAGSLDLGGFTVLGSTTQDGSAGEDKQDSYEVGATTAVGTLNLAVGFAKDQNTDVETTLFAASTDIGGLTLGGAFETDETSAGVETDTWSTVAAMDVGQNTVKVGYQDAEGGSETTTVEGVHNFSSKTSAYVNVQDADTAADNTYTVGLRVNF